MATGRDGYTTNSKDRDGQGDHAKADTPRVKEPAVAAIGAARRRGAGRRTGVRRAGSGAPRSGDGTDNPVRMIFLRRMDEWLRQLAGSTPPDVLADALARPTARAAILHVLDVVPSNEERSEGEILREQALQRALAVREDLARDAGGMLSTHEVAEQLGVTRQSVDRYRTSGKLLARETPQGYVFPRCQLDADGIVPGLDAALAAMAGMNFWEALSALVTPVPAFGGRSVLDALRNAGPEQQRRIREILRAYVAE